jgi:hypothetical protein
MVTESTSRQASTSRAATSHPSTSRGRLARRAAGAILLALCLLTGAGPAVRADSPPLGIFIYTIARDGTPIGQQRVEFVDDGEKLRVISHAELEVTLLGLTLFDFNQQVEEVRAGDKIMSLTSDADDDGTDRKVSLILQGDVLKGEYNGNDREADPTLVTSLFWQKPQIGDTRVIDCLRGRVREVTVKDLGVETLALPVGRVETHHYQMTGDWKRDLWYDASGVLVAGQLEKGGAMIRQELQQRP